MKPAIVFPQYSLVIWTLCAPLVVAIVEWFISRRQRSALIHHAEPKGYADANSAR